MSATKHEIESRSVRPVIRPVRTENLPVALRDYAQWVHWSYERATGRPSWTKVPFHIEHVGGVGGRPLRPFRYNASSTDPRTWRDFEAIAGATIIAEDAGTVGMGFVLTTDDPILCIDLDDCRNRETGELTAFAADMVRRLDSYTEVSPSGTGLKIFLLAKKPGERCKETKLRVEMYDQGRFVAVTGQHLPGTPADLQDRQEIVGAIYAELFPEPEPAPRSATGCASARRPTDLSDQAILDRANAAANGFKFDRLWRGDTSHYKHDASAADAALAAMLAFWTDDAGQIARLMWSSGLARDKWSARKDYLDRTIQKAQAGQRAHYGDGNYDADDLAAELACLRQAGVQIVEDHPSRDSAVSPRDPLAGLERFTVAPGQMGHPDYWQEEREAAARIKDGRYDFTRYPCPDAIERIQEHLYTCRPRVLKIRCRQRSCNGCRRWLDDREMENCRLRLENVEESGQTIMRLRCTEAQWATTHKAIARKHGDYIAVRTPAGWEIFTNARLKSTEDRPVTCATAAEGCTVIADYLLLYAGRKRPIHTSHGWKLPEEKGPGLHKNVGVLSANRHDDLIDEAAAAVDATTEIKVPKNDPDASQVMQVTYLNRTAGWHDEAVRSHLYFMLGCGEVFPASLAVVEDATPPVIEPEQDLVIPQRE